MTMTMYRTCPSRRTRPARRSATELGRFERGITATFGRETTGDAPASIESATTATTTVARIFLVETERVDQQTRFRLAHYMRRKEVILLCRDHLTHHSRCTECSGTMSVGDARRGCIQN